jgi:hypothetical protein
MAEEKVMSKRSLFVGSSSINNAPMPRGAKGWALFALLFPVVLGGTLLIQHGVRPPGLALLLTIILWVVPCGGFTLLAFRGANFPSRGR